MRPDGNAVVTGPARSGPAPADSARAGTAAVDRRAAFEAFVREVEPRLRRATVAAYGLEEGRDAAAEALAYAWEHWDRLQDIANLPGYLYRVAQSRSRRRRQPVLFDTAGGPDYQFEPGLPGALAALSQRQRLAVVLVHGYGYTLREAGELTGLRPATLRNHLARGLSRLRTTLGVTDEN
jgi:DNA-directed RNA polymerase specialized sigma24 family protein